MYRSGSVARAGSPKAGLAAYAALALGPAPQPRPRYNSGMPALSLTAHPETPCPAIQSFVVHCDLSESGLLRLRYRLAGDSAGLAIPAANPAPERRDELWRHTCCEVFLAEGGGPAYWEGNFSPAGDWALYHFTAYRQGMTAPAITRPPAITVSRDPACLQLRAELDLAGLGWPNPEQPEPPRLALAAVVATRAGAPSYWALRHPPGPPDFHHPDSFTLRLPG